MDLSKKEKIFKVLDKDEFEKRIVPVMKEAGSILAKSFGKYGSNTFIGSGVHAMATKDGYTIAKYLSARDELDKIDSMIYNMMRTPCDRINNIVGDGTTTAFISTESIYNSYIEVREELKKLNFVPKDIIEVFIKIRDMIIEGIQKKAIKIDINDEHALADSIYKVLFISTNGDEEISQMISDMYRELKYPSIQVEMSLDGSNHKKIIDGYQLQVVTADGIYINADNEICNIKDADVLIFDLKITAEVYNTILKPINDKCKIRGRRLVVIATQYDDVAMEGLIASDLRSEYRVEGIINMVLCTASAKGSDDKKRLSDLAMLLNTSIINQSIKEMGFESINDIVNAFDVDKRGIPGIIIYDNNSLFVDDGQSNRVSDAMIRVGFCHECELGRKDKSIFRGFHYNTKAYNQHTIEAREDLERVRAKYESMGIFNTEIATKQERLYSLGLKVGIIEIGGDSDLMQKFLKDKVVDGVKAAASAYHHGLIQGCNVTTLQVLHDLRPIIFDEYGKDSIELIIHNIFYNGFKDVYKTVLKNMCEDERLPGNPAIDEDAKAKRSKVFIHVKNHMRQTKNSFDIFDSELLRDAIISYGANTVHEAIINYSILSGKVFDLNKKEFNTDVVNSTQTDIEVLKAVTDLIALLISGNQLVLM